MQCDLCGAEGRLFKAIVEGTELTVCENCSKHGKVLKEVREVAEEKHQFVQQESKPEVIEMILPDYGEKIRKKREQLGLNHEEFARKISEKESIIHKLETGHLEPSIKLAEKLKKMFGLNLIEEYAEATGEYKESKAEGVTIGDMIKIKTRKSK